MIKVSICMLAYNTEKFIRQAMESVLAQKTDFDFEIVIAEDCSTDNTRQIAREYALRFPEKIKLILNPANLGLSENYLVALKNCTAEYIAMLDSDDYWGDPYKLQKQINFLDKNREYGLVYTDCDIINQNDVFIDWSEMNFLREHFSSGYLFFKLLKETAFIPNLTTCFRKELITTDLQNEDIWFFEDWWLWMRISMKTNFHYMDERTSFYRRHLNNITITRFENNEKKMESQRRAYLILYSNIIYFDQYNKLKLNRSEQEILAKKIMMLLNRSHNTIKMKIKLLSILLKYFPGPGTFTRLLFEKVRRIKLFNSNKKSTAMFLV